RCRRRGARRMRVESTCQDYYYNCSACGHLVRVARVHVAVRALSRAVCMALFVQVQAAMRYHVLAADYDGTLARDGRIEGPTYAALHRLRDSGRKAVMVTGRELGDLLALVAEPELFARRVAANGAGL